MGEKIVFFRKGRLTGIQSHSVLRNKSWDYWGSNRVTKTGRGRWETRFKRETQRFCFQAEIITAPSLPPCYTENLQTWTSVYECVILHVETLVIWYFFYNILINVFQHSITIFLIVYCHLIIQVSWKRKFKI